MNPQYDSTLIGILQNEGSLEKYLDVMFGFLMRRTDFFYEHQPGDKLGFPPGYALKLVLKTYEKYHTIFKKYQEQHLKGKVIDDIVDDKHATSKPSDTKADGQLSNPASTVDLKQKPSKPTQKASTGPGSTFKKDKNGERFYEAEPDCYNGARRDLYSWSQQILEIDIRVKIPCTIKSARELDVKISRKHIFISEKGAENPILDLELFKEIKTETAQWSFEVNEHIVSISLDKVDEYWWEAAFVGEDKINVQEIDCSRPMHELDEESQGKIAQMLYDQEQKRLGLPTTEEKLHHLNLQVP
uniref:CS domain-containing protein n=1 Tax=Mesocestoides corti TaxID=53468 RepID=A0A5K3EEV5_MESCO